MTRFTVGSVTGWAINQGTSSQGHAPVSIWYVLDSAYCHREVACFWRWSSGWDRYDRALVGKRKSGSDPEQFAHRYAAALEEHYS